MSLRAKPRKKGYVERGAAPSDAGLTTPKPSEPAKAKADASLPPPAELAAAFRAFLDAAKMNAPEIDVPPPATEAQLAALQAGLGFPLPAGLRTLLEVSNGPSAPLFRDSGLLSTEEMLAAWQFCKGAVQARPDQQLVPFAYDNGIYAN